MVTSVRTILNPTAALTYVTDASIVLPGWIGTEVIATGYAG